MNILQILPELNVGGVETGTVDLARHLIKLGHKAVVVSCGGELVKELEGFGAIHYQLPVHKKSLFTMLKMIPALARIIKKEQIHIVHARSRVPAWIGYFASRRTGAIFITTCHGYYRKHPFSRVMGWGKRVIVLSNCIARHMLDDFGAPFERIRLVPRSVDLEKFKYKGLRKRNGEFNVGLIGRLTPIKGHLHFIKAMAKVARVIPRLKIWIVGDAPVSREAYKEQIQVLVRRLGLWHCTEFLGTQRDIPEILSHLDALVLPTVTHEAFGRVIVEAQAVGVPVVATEVGGVVDIIENGVNGLLVPPQDPASLSSAIIRIFKDEALAAKLVENAYKKVKEKYAVEFMVNNTLEVYKDAVKNLKILLIKFSSLGDVILSTAAIKAVREKFSRTNYKISFLTSVDSKDVLVRCPYIDELLVADFKNKDKGLNGILNLAKMLRRQNFDIVIDLQNNRKSHLLSFLSASINRYGYDNKKLSFLLNHRVKDAFFPTEPIAHQFRILKLLGIELADSYTKAHSTKDIHLELWPSSADRQHVDDLLNSHWLSPNQKIIGINISASEKWVTKNWPLSHIARLCEQLGPKDIRAVITGTQKDLTKAEDLMNMVKNIKPINLCAKTNINELACLIKRCSVYISMDSSPLHIAASVGTPFLALFGPTDPARHLPPSERFVVIKKDLACSPCYKSKCKTKKCMEMISPEEVLEAVGRLLSDN